MITEFSIFTPKRGYTDITDIVAKIVQQGDVAQGVCCLYTTKSGAGIFTASNEDEFNKQDIVDDFLKIFMNEECCPEPATSIGAVQVVSIIDDRKMDLGANGAICVLNADLSGDIPVICLCL